MNARTLSIPIVGLAIGLICWPAPSARSSVNLAKAFVPTAGSGVSPAGGAAIAGSAMFLQLGQTRNGQMAASLGSSALTSAFSGTVNISPASSSALYAGVTVSLPSPDASVSSQIEHFDIVLLDLNTGSAFSILPMFTGLTLIPNGDLVNPMVTAILSTAQFDEMALASTAAAAGGAFEIVTIVTGKDGNMSKDHYYLLSNFSEPAGPVLLEQRPVTDPGTGEITGASFNYLAGPAIVLGSPPAQGKRLFLAVSGLIGPDEDGSYLSTVQAADCFDAALQRCVSAFYPPGSLVRVYP